MAPSRIRFPCATTETPFMLYVLSRLTSSIHIFSFYCFVVAFLSFGVEYIFYSFQSFFFWSMVVQLLLVIWCFCEWRLARVLLFLPSLSFLSFFFFLAFSRATPTAYGGPQARGQIRAVATNLRQSHSNTGSLTH